MTLSMLAWSYIIILFGSASLLAVVIYAQLKREIEKESELAELEKEEFEHRFNDLFYD